MARDDLRVRGGGVAGLSVAYEAARRGMKVRLIERARIGAGASGGLIGALAPHAPEGWTAGKEFQLAALLGAEAYWAEVARIGGVDPGYGRLGRLQPIADEAALVLAEERALAARDLWRGEAVWEVIAPPGHGFVPVSPTGRVIHDTLTARISPRGALASLAAAFVALGGEIEIDPEAPELPQDDVPQEEGLTVWATGAAGLAALSGDLGRKAGQGVKGQALSLAFEAKGLPQIYADGLYLVPHADGTVAVGSTSENSFAHEAVDAQCDALLERACAVLPALRGAREVTRWAGVRPRAQSRQPLVGAWPGRPGHVIANGGFKIGFAVAAPVARLVVDLIEGQDAIPAVFKP